MPILPIAYNYKSPSRTAIFLGSRHYPGSVPSLVPQIYPAGLAEDRSRLVKASHSVLGSLKSVVTNVGRLTVPSVIVTQALNVLPKKCSGVVRGAISLVGSLFHVHRDCDCRVEDLAANLEQTQQALVASEADRIQALQQVNQAQLHIVELEQLLDETSDKWMNEADRAHDAETKLEVAQATHKAYVAATKDKEAASAKKNEETNLALVQSREEFQRLAVKNKILEKKNEDQAGEISRLNCQNKEQKEEDAMERTEIKNAYERKLETQAGEFDAAKVISEETHKKELEKKNNEIHELGVKHAKEVEEKKEEEEKKKIETTKGWEAKLKASDDEGARRVKLVYALWKETEKELKNEVYRTTQQFGEHKKQVEKDSDATEMGWMLKMAEKDAEIKRGKETITEMTQKLKTYEDATEEAEKRRKAKEVELQQTKQLAKALEQAAEDTGYEKRVLNDCVVAIGDKMEVILQEDTIVVEENDDLKQRLTDMHTQLREQTSTCRRLVDVANRQVVQVAIHQGQITVLTKEKSQLQWELTELGKVVAHQLGLEDHFDGTFGKLASLAREHFDDDRLVALAGGVFVPRDDFDMSDSESTLNASEPNSQEDGKDEMEEQEDLFPEDDAQIAPTYAISDEILEDLDEYLLMLEGTSSSEGPDSSATNGILGNTPIAVTVDEDEASSDAVEGPESTGGKEPVATNLDSDRNTAAVAQDGAVASASGDIVGAIIGDIDSLIMEIGRGRERRRR